MPSLREARLRHAAYYLRRVREELKDYLGRKTDWEELDNHIVQVRAAREWLRQNESDPAAKDLLIAYGELAWELLDVTQARLTALLVSAREAGSGAGLNEEIMKRLDEILLAQRSIQSALPQVFTGGDRSVAAMSITNSNIYTGDVYVTRPGDSGPAQYADDADEEGGRDAPADPDDKSSGREFD